MMDDVIDLVDLNPVSFNLLFSPFLLGLFDLLAQAGFRKGGQGQIAGQKEYPQS